MKTMRSMSLSRRTDDRAGSRKARHRRVGITALSQKMEQIAHEG
jgi:hypothetical protein